MQSYPSEHIVNCARTIRGCIHTLLSEEEGNKLDNALSNLLTKSAEENRVELIREHLGQYPNTREWTRRFLEWAASHVNDNYRGGYEPLTSPSSRLPLAPKYACPKCQVPWPQRMRGRTIPKCIICHVTYELVTAVYVCPKCDLIRFGFGERTSLTQCRICQMSLNPVNVE